MLHLIWLTLIASCGCAAGKIVGGKGLGVVADMLLGVSGALAVRFLVDTLRVPVPDIGALFLSVWAAAAMPALLRFLIRHHERGGFAQASQTHRFVKSPVSNPSRATTPIDESTVKRGSISNRVETGADEVRRQAS